MSTLEIYELHPPPTLSDYHHDMICKPYMMPLIAPTDIKTQNHGKN
jgi:hypothetical protein